MESELDSTRAELVQERRRLESQLRAPFDGRWGDDSADWHESMERRRERIAVLEERVAELEQAA